MMRARLIHGIALLLTGFVFLMSSATLHHPTYAEETQGSPAGRSLETVDEKGKRIQCADIPKAKTGVLVGYIVPCVTKTIENATVLMAQAVTDWLMPMVYAFITLVVVLFGVRILQGGGQLHSEGILLLLKIGLVLALLEMLPASGPPLLHKVMEQSQEIIAGTITPDTDSIHCDIKKYGAGETATVWMQMDCLIGKLYGITVGSDGSSGEKRPNMLLAASVFGMLGGFFFGGTFGIILFFTMVGVLWTMFVMVLRTIASFLNGYLYAALLIIVAPLFMPLILLKASTPYFEPWWKGILGGIMLPIVISAYTMFAMLLYDKMLFDTGEKSGEKALLYQLFDHELLKKAQDIPRPLCDMQRPGDLAQRAEALGVEEQAIYANNPFFRNFVNPLLMGANNQCLGLTRPSLEMTRALEVNTNREAFTQLFHDSVKLLVLGIMITMGLSNVNALARRLTGSSGVSSTLDTRGQVEEQFARTREMVKQRMAGHFIDSKTKSSVSGGEFIRRLATVPEAIGAGITGGRR